MKPKITVYIVSHNYGKYILEAINSVFRQTVEDWELLLINDGSKDETEHIIEKFRSYEKVRIFHTKGIGLPSVNNLALKDARGKYIIRLDADDVLDENILLILSNYLDNDEALALVFPDYYLVDEVGRVFSHEVRRKLHLEDKLLDVPPNGACTMVRTNVLNKVGGYREDLGAQDGLDLWLKIKDSYKSTNVNLPLFYYRRHGKNLTDQPFKILNARRNLKSDKASAKIQSNRPINVIIPCREHYDFVDNLWAQMVAGKSLLERDLEVCINSKLVDNIIVACDNVEAWETVKKFEKDSRVKFFFRETSLTMSSRSIVDTLDKIVHVFDKHRQGILVLRYIQTPFVSYETIEEAVNTLLISDADSAFAVEKIYHEIFERQDNGLVPLNPANSGQLFNPELYRDSSTCVAVRTRCLKGGSIRGSNSSSYPVSGAESFFIRNTIDLEIAQYLDQAK